MYWFLLPLDGLYCVCAKVVSCCDEIPVVNLRPIGITEEAIDVTFGDRVLLFIELGLYGADLSMLIFSYQVSAKIPLRPSIRPL